MEFHLTSLQMYLKKWNVVVPFRFQDTFRQVYGLVVVLLFK